MMKNLLSATALALLMAAPVAAQTMDRSATSTTTTTTTRPATADVRTETRAEQPKVVQQPGQIDTERLIGRNITNPEGDRIGEVDSVLIGRDGKIQAVIVGVGGFLGIGERKVAIDWNDLKFQDNDQRVVANMTRDQLKAMPEFAYADRATTRDRTDRVATRDAATPATSAQNRAEGRPATTDGRVAVAPMTTDRPATAATDRPGTAATATAGARDMKELGQLRADEIIGKNVVNARGETVGEIEDIVIDTNKAVMAVVSVGGFLGMGDRDVAIPFDKLRMNERNAILMSEANQDALKQLPAYKKSETWRSIERNRPVLDR